MIVFCDPFFQLIRCQNYMVGRDEKNSIVLISNKGHFIKHMVYYFA